jgi:non-specific protein-tyrosine kinase
VQKLVEQSNLIYTLSAISYFFISFNSFHFHKDLKMELMNYLQIFNRRKWIVILTTLLTAIITTIGSFIMTPIYSASAFVRIAQIQNSDIDFYDLNYTQRLMNTYALLLSSGHFLEQVIEKLNLDIKAEELENFVEVRVVGGTELIEIIVENPDPVQSMQIANTIGSMLVEQREDLYTGEGRSTREILEDQLEVVQENLINDRSELQRYILEGADLEQEGELQDLSIRIQVQEQTYAMLLEQYDNAVITEAAFANSITLAKPATTPSSPNKPDKFLNIALGSLVGLVGGLGLAVLFESMDTTIHSINDLENSVPLPILGALPEFRRGFRSNHRASLVMDKNQSTEREAFRILRTNMQSLLSSNSTKTLMITSAKRETGTSTVLINLAIAIAQTGKEVVVIDSNLRTPCLHETFGLGNDLGLSTIVTDPDELTPDSWLEETKFPGVKLFSSGPLPHNPAERLSSENMKLVLSELSQIADYILLDSPATLEYADAASLAPMIDDIAIIVTKNMTTVGELQKTLLQMDNVSARTIGCIFNKATD